MLAVADAHVCELFHSFSEGFINLTLLHTWILFAACSNAGGC
jgi:hypothetical protein